MQPVAAPAEDAPAAAPAETAAPASEPTPVENASLDDAALAGVGVETTADEEIGALTEPIATDAITPDGVPAGEAVDADATGR